MSTPLPVPSKAALRALRGLAFGTTCALGLILEDRRRRICTLTKAVDNKKKLQSSKKYHQASEAAAILKLEDISFLDGEDLNWHLRRDVQSSQNNQRPSNGTRGGRFARHTAWEDVESTIAEDPIALQTSEQFQRSESGVKGNEPITSANSLRTPSSRLSSKTPSGTWGLDHITENAHFRHKTVKEREPLELQIDRLLASEDDDRLEKAVARFTKGSELEDIVGSHRAAWIAISQRLCQACLEAEKPILAQAVLGLVLKAGLLDETQYYAYEPFNIIEAILPLPEEKSVMAKTLKATELFLAKFKEKPSTHIEEVEELGRDLISRLLTLRRPREAQQVYWRVLGQLQESADFVSWFITSLHDASDYKSVVSFYLAHFSKTHPTTEGFHNINKLVVESVEEMQGLKAGSVLKVMNLLAQTTGHKPMASHAMRIFQAQWACSNNFQTCQELFEELLSLGFLDRLQHPAGFYNVMIEISLRSERPDMANHYYGELLKIYPKGLTDIRQRKFVALAKAKMGDWEGVRQEFAAMQGNAAKQPKDYDVAFHLVLKAFVETHPVEEVDTFIQQYRELFHVRLHPYSVTLVAEKYGQTNDSDGFIRWLDSCGLAGFGANEGLCNSVLFNGWRKWNIPFDKLLKLYCKMKGLSPAVDNQTAHRIMHTAALQSNKPRAFALAQLQRAGIPITCHSSSGGPTDWRGVQESMQKHLAAGKPAQAAEIYKRAMRMHMSFSPACFRLAVQAAIEQPRNGIPRAMMLIRQAHHRGQDVTQAVLVYLKAHIASNRASPGRVMENLGNTIRRLEALKIYIDPSVLTHAATISIKTGYLDRAVDLCKLAMARSGTSNPCFSPHCFGALLRVYQQTLNLEGMKWLLESLPTSANAANTQCRVHLKSAKGHLKRFEPSGRVVAMIDLINKGLTGIRERRGEELGQSDKITEVTLRIMGDAVNNVQRKGQFESKTVKVVLPGNRVPPAPEVPLSLPQKAIASSM